HVLTKAKRVELIDPDVIVEVGAAGLGTRSLDLGAGCLPVLEALGRRVEAPEMAAAGGEPEDAVGRPVNPARPVARQRDLIPLVGPGFRIELVHVVAGELGKRGLSEDTRI